MKKYLFIAFISFCCGACAQNTSGKITYDADFMFSPIDTANVADSDAKSYIVQAMKRKRKALLGERAMYQLVFNQHEAIYKAIPMMYSDANKGLNPDKAIYYINNKTEQQFKKIHFSGRTYRITKSKDRHEWQITNQSKKIQGYTCYRAIKKVERPKKTIHITAWFAPAIPLHYGPKGYNGLPGLILGLEEHGIYYRALSVQLKHEEKEIKIPTDGELISREKFNEKIMQL